MPFCSRYPRIVVPIFIEIETASTAPLTTSTGIVCMSAISHKVNTENELVNGYLGGPADSRTCPGSSRASYPLKPEALLEHMTHWEPVRGIPKPVTRSGSRIRLRLVQPT